MTILSENGLHALRAVRHARRLIRNNLAGQLGVSLSLATKISAGLIERGLLRESGRSESDNGGRPSNYLTLAPEGGYAVGVDFDPDHTVAVLLDLCGGQVACIEETPGNLPDRKAVLDCIQEMTLQLIAQSGVPRDRVFGMGACLGRTVDPVNGLAYGWPHFSGWEDLWHTFPLRAELQPRLALPHVLVDDVVRALGTAEAHYGLGTLEQDFIFVLVDSGIGMAFMTGGHPYIGTSHIAMELGHIPIQGRDVRCACGNNGCLEELVSAPSILRRLSERMLASPVQSELRFQNGETRIQDVIRAASASDKLAYPLLIEAGEDLGKGLAIVVNLLGPGLIVIGGAMAASDVFVDAARRELKLRALQQASQVVEIRSTKQDETAAARGSATQVLDALFEPGPGNILALTWID